MASGSQIRDAEHHDSQFRAFVPLAPEDTSSKLNSLISRLNVIFEDKAQYRQLLICRNARAQKLLDLFQELLDTTVLDASFRRSLIVATQRLSRRSGLFPGCYILEGVQYAGDPVAAGSFADIYKGDFRGRSVCIKVIRIYQTSRREYLEKKYAKEALLWGQLEHPNVCPIYGLYRRKSGIIGLVSPWMDNGDLNDYLRQYPQADRALLVYDAAQGLLYLHDNGIVHGDLKGANILVSASGRARLADFGLSSVSDANILAWTSNSSAESKGGSVRWQAPELFNFEADDAMPNSKASDIYAWSSACYEAFTGAVPFAHLTYDVSVILQVKAGTRPLRPSDDSPSWITWGLTENMWSIMTNCWNADFSSRPTVHDVVESLAYKLHQDQRPLDEPSTISTARFRKETGIHQDIISVDALERLAGFDPSSLLHLQREVEHAPNSASDNGPWKDTDGLQTPYVDTPDTLMFTDLADPITSNTMLDLADVYYKQDQRKKAEPLRIAAMERRKDKLGVDHADTLASMVELADGYSDQKEAEALQVLVMKSREQTLGVGHHDTLSIMADLAYTYFNQGRWREAGELGVVLMESQKQTLGVDHPDTLVSMHRLAITYSHQGRWKEAEDLEVVLMDWRKRTLGIYHPDTLMCMKDLATTYSRQGRWKEAAKLQVLLMEKWRQTLGAENPSTLEIMANLAFTYSQQGQWKEAEQVQMMLMEKRKSMLGIDHPDTLIIMLALAATYSKQGRWKEAGEIQVAVVEMGKRTFGADDADTLECMKDLATSYSMQGRWKEAQELQVLVMEKWKGILGLEDPDTLNIMVDLASTLFNLGQWKEAEELLATVVEERKQTLGIDHPDTLTSMKDLATVYNHQGRWKEAEELQMQ